MTRLLFQGDSITDADRNRSSPAPNDSGAMGRGYAFLAMCRLLKEHPGANLSVFNRGVSGDRVGDLDARWEQDCLALEPDVLSILVGVNDMWRKIDGGSKSTPRDYERELDGLLGRTQEALPGVRLVLGEPFALHCGAVSEAWFPEMDERRAVARDIAAQHDAVFVAFHEVLTEAAAKEQNPAHWAHDGVHPTPQGHQLMADAWLQACQAPLFDGR